MPRNGSGVYSLPAGVLVTNGDVTDASQHNPALQDFAADANEPRPIVAGGTGATSASAARSALGVAASSSPTIEGTATFTGEIVTADIEAVTGSFSGQLSANGVMRSAPNVAATLSSTDHAYQAGPTSGENLALGADGLQARNNGAGSTLHLNSHGGAVEIGDASSYSGLSLNGDLSGTAVSSQAEAEAGSSAVRIMTPYRTEQHMLANALGWGQTWQAVTRTVETVYQNATGKPIMVAVSCGGIYAQAFVGEANPPTLRIAYNNAGGNGSLEQYHVSFIVPAGHYYKLSGVIGEVRELR